MIDDIMKYIKIVYENQWLFPLAVAVLLPFAVIVAGWLINCLGIAVGTLAGSILGPKAAFGIINYVFFPGTMLHETAHALFAVLTGAKVTEVALFKREGDSLGHVNFINRGNAFIVAIQNIFTSSAPMFVGAAVIFGCGYVIFFISGLAWWIKAILWYIAISMFFHMTMSPQDIKIYLRGVPLFMMMIYVVVLILRLAKVV